MTQYEQDPINGKWKPVVQKGFTDKEWEEFCKKWEKGKPQKKKIDWEIVFMAVFFYYPL